MIRFLTRLHRTRSVKVFALMMCVFMVCGNYYILTNPNVQGEKRQGEGMEGVGGGVGGGEGLLERLNQRLDQREGLEQILEKRLDQREEQRLDQREEQILDQRDELKLDQREEQRLDQRENINDVPVQLKYQRTTTKHQRNDIEYQRNDDGNEGDENNRNIARPPVDKDLNEQAQKVGDLDPNPDNWVIKKDGNLEPPGLNENMGVPGEIENPVNIAGLGNGVQDNKDMGEDNGNNNINNDNENQRLRHIPEREKYGANAEDGQNTDMSSVLKKLGVSEDILRFRIQRFKDYQTRKPRIGDPGEMGRAVKLNKEEEALAKEKQKTAKYNVVAGDKVALDRLIADIRPKQCQSLHYPKDLPTTSIVIIFYNEHLRTLLRTITSIVNRSPPELLKEIVLVDDSSDSDELADLDAVLSQMWPDGIVRRLRTSTRSGLIRARMTGARATTGDVLVMLDAHVEVGVQWLEPILYRIRQDRRILLSPTVDRIFEDHFGIMTDRRPMVGSFNWFLSYVWQVQPEHEARRRGNNTTEGLRTATLIGCAMAIERNYFFEIGAFDEGMDVWGGENLELPIRVWMCGGSVEYLPCSHVAHLFRPLPYATRVDRRDIASINAKRFAEVWMDEYKNYYYNIRWEMPDMDIGDVSARVELRQTLQCHNFRWFLDNVVPEHFVPDENIVLKRGQVKNTQENLCFNILREDEQLVNVTLKVAHCHARTLFQEYFYLTKTGQLRKEQKCLQPTPDNNRVILIYCHENDPKQKWEYTESGHLHNPWSAKCLDVGGVAALDYIRLNPCLANPSQLFHFQYNSA